MARAVVEYRLRILRVVIHTPPNYLTGWGSNGKSAMHTQIILSFPAKDEPTHSERVNLMPVFAFKFIMCITSNQPKWREMFISIHLDEQIGTKNANAEHLSWLCNSLPVLIKRKTEQKQQYINTSQSTKATDKQPFIKQPIIHHDS